MTKIRTFITGSGRCGTKSVAYFLDGLLDLDGRTVRASHESESEKLLDSLVRGEVSEVQKIFAEFRHDIEVTPYLCMLPPEFSLEQEVVGIVRDGRDVVVSGMNTGWFLPDQGNTEDCSSLNAEIEGDRFSKCCQVWAKLNKRLAGFGAPIIRLEDLVSGRNNAREHLLEAARIRQTDRPFPRRNRSGPTKALVRKSVAPTPSWRSWTRQQSLEFTRYCGELMNRYYPGWSA